MTLAVGVASLAVVLGLRRFLPVVPGSLVAVALGVVAVSLFDAACSMIASASVVARPSCRYGAVEPTPHKFSVRNVS